MPGHQGISFSSDDDFAFAAKRNNRTTSHRRILSRVSLAPSCAALDPTSCHNVCKSRSQKRFLAHLAARTNDHFQCSSLTLSTSASSHYLCLMDDPAATIDPNKLSLYLSSALFRRNAVFLTSIFVGAFAFEMYVFDPLLRLLQLLMRLNCCSRRLHLTRFIRLQ